jgi:hypothetical protein
MTESTVRNDAEASPFLRFQCRLSFQEFLEYVAVRKRVNKAWRFVLGMRLVAGLLMLAGLYALTTEVQHGFVPLFGTGAMLFVVTLLEPWYVRREFQRTTPELNELVVEIGPTGIMKKTSVREDCVGWPIVKELVDAPEGMIYYAERRFPIVWLPQREFEGNDKRQALIAETKRRGVSIIRSPRKDI